MSEMEFKMQGSCSESEMVPLDQEELNMENEVGISTQPDSDEVSRASSIDFRHEIDLSQDYGYSRYLILAIALICSIWSTGLIFGWAPLYGLLIRAGVYSNECYKDTPDTASGYINWVKILEVYLQPGRMVGVGVIRNDATSDGAFITCANQQKKLNLIYTAGSACTQASLFLTGIVLDWQGPKMAITASAGIVALGAFLFGLSAANVTDLYILGFALMGFGGAGVNLATYTVSNLFPRRKSWVVSALVGVWTLSSLWFLLFRPAYDSGISLPSLFYAQAILVSFTAVLFFFTFPSRSLREGEAFHFKEWLPWNASKAKNRDLLSEEMNTSPETSSHVMNQPVINNPLSLVITPSNDMDSTTRVDALRSDPMRSESPISSSKEAVATSASKKRSRSTSKLDFNQGKCTDLDIITEMDADESDNARVVDVDNEVIRGAANRTGNDVSMVRSIVNEVLTVDFILLAIWFAVSVLFFEFYIGTIADALDYRTAKQPSLSPEKITTTIDIYVLVFNLIYAFGFVFVPIYAWTTDHIGFTGSFFLATLFAVLYPLISMITWLPSQFFAYVLYSAGIQFFYSCQFGFISSRFGYEHFGVLVGVIGILTACLIPLQSVFLRLVLNTFHGNFFWMYLIQACITIPLFGIVLWNWIKTRRATVQADQVI